MFFRLCWTAEIYHFQILDDGYKADVQANKVAMGEEFVLKRSKRKMEVYKDSKVICFNNGQWSIEDID